MREFYIHTSLIDLNYEGQNSDSTSHQVIFRTTLLTELALF